MILPVILAGGHGDRLWPLSRESYPKQFLTLHGKHSLLQNTLLRLPPESLPPVVVCHEDYRFLVAEQFRALNLPLSTIILEPEGKNTAPAIGLAAEWAEQHYPQAQLLVLPADHVIADEAQFHQAIHLACPFAAKGELVCLGVPPTQPATGYGYIAAGAQVADKTYQISQFIEKPNLEDAKAFVQSGKYHWNCGIFVFSPAGYLSALSQFEPEMHQLIHAAMNNANIDDDFTRPNKHYYQKCPKNSIDYAVLEKTSSSKVILLNSYWNDIGDWNALWEGSPKDQQGNSLSGAAKQIDSHNTLIHASHRLVTALGVEDLIIVETPDAILVADRKQAQHVKHLVQELRDAHQPEASEHKRVFRPWGYYEQISCGERFQAKRILVNPKQKLSLQLHHHRSEHWVVVKGSAKVTRGEEVFLLTENQSTYIPAGTKHRLENNGKIPLEVIEIQSGSYLGEDDIIRFADEHGREVTREDYTTALN